MNSELVHRETTELIIKAFYEVYNTLGAGFLESVYKRAIAVALRAKGLRVEMERRYSVFYLGENVGDYRADLVIEGKVIIETKTAPRIDEGHALQSVNYLKASKMHVALILNFGPKPEFERVFLSRP